MRQALRKIPQYAIICLLTALIILSAVYICWVLRNLNHGLSDVIAALVIIISLAFISMTFVLINSYKERAQREKIKNLQNLLQDNLLIAENARSKAENFEILAEKATNLAIEASKAAKSSNEAKSDFLAHTSHEIRTPMGAIIGLSNLLLSTPLNDKQKLYLKTLKDCAESLITLVNDLLDLRKIESRMIESEAIPFNPKDLLENIIAIMRVKAEEKGVGLYLKYPLSLNKNFIGDPNHIRQIMINLIGNAIKFTDKGDVSVLVQEGVIKNGKQTINFTVEDMGIGIPKDKLEKVFESFTQVDSSISKKYGGSGLGLSISKALAEAIGGSISVKSKLDKGSVFTLHLLLPEHINTLMVKSISY